MNNILQDDTICALSTGGGLSAIAIIRLSGKDAIKITNSVFSKDIISAKTHTIHFGTITENNKIIVGCNVENAAYPQSQCAEASAIGNLVSQGFSNIIEVVVIGSGDILASPCGGCRQRLREFSALDTPIHMCNINGHLKTLTLAELLPDSFGPENL